MRRFTVVFAALALVALMVTPAMAAKPNLTFVTHLTQDNVQLAGNQTSGFVIVTSGVKDVQYNIQTTKTKANPGVVEGPYHFYLKASTEQQVILTDYFVAKGWPYPAFYTQINEEIAGNAPFFTLAVGAGNGWFLQDGFHSGLACLFPDGETCFFDWGMYQLALDADYPVGSYTYEGTLLGTNGASRTFSIVMTVVRG
jgi:hypothetical protein